MFFEKCKEMLLWCRCCLVLLCFLCVNAADLKVCHSSDDKQEPRLLSYELLDTYSQKSADEIFAAPVVSQLFGQGQINNAVSTLGVSANSVNVYTIMYKTVNYDGGIVDVSGLVLIPDVVNVPMPLLLYLHGTVFERNMAPSFLQNSLEGQLVLAVFAAHGYIVCLPDYIGQGKSDIMHPYMHAATEAQTGLDMLRATKELLNKLNVCYNEKLFLAGYSQGGHATMATQRLIESKYGNELKITASAPMSGIYNLNMLWETMSNSSAMIASLVTARIVKAYKKIYDWPEKDSDVFREQYIKALDLIDSDAAGVEMVVALPRKSSDLFMPSFIENFAVKKTGSFYDSVEKNNVYNWAPIASTHLYYTKGDTLVPYSNTVFALTETKKIGGNVKSVEVSETLDHTPAVLPSMVMAKKWFDLYLEQ